MNVTLIGIDLAKSVFQVCAVNQAGKTVFNRQVRQRTAVINQIRGFLMEYGIVVPRGKERLQHALPELLEDGENALTPSARALLSELSREWRHQDGVIRDLQRRIKQQAQANEAARRLMAIKGVGERIATAIVAHAGNAKGYRNGRHFSANLGLVPREHSSGGKQQLGGMSKRGIAYLRRLLIQGAWTVVRYAEGSEDRLSQWAREVTERRGKHKAVVAVANKMARIMWSMLYHQTDYRAV